MINFKFGTLVQRLLCILILSTGWGVDADRVVENLDHRSMSLSEVPDTTTGMADVLSVVSFTTEEALSVEVSQYVGSYGGGLALSSTSVFASGTLSTLTMPKSTLDPANAEIFSQTDLILVNNAANNQLYALGDANSGFVTGPSVFAECFIPLMPTSLRRDAAQPIIWFSEPIYLSHKSSIYMGHNRAVLTDGDSGESYAVNLRDGVVSFVGDALERTPAASTAWANVGVAETDETFAYNIVHSSLELTIERQRLTDPAQEVTTMLDGMVGDVASIALDTIAGRWYVYYTGSGSFGTGAAVLASAMAIVDAYEVMPSTSAPTGAPTAPTDFDYFGVEFLTDERASLRDVSAVTGAYLGDLGVSNSKVFASGELSVVSVGKDSLKGSAITALSYSADESPALVTNLANNRLYALGDRDGGFLSGPSGYVACLIPLSGTTLQRDTAAPTVTLSSPLYLSHQSSVYSGRNHAYLVDRDSAAVYDVNLLSGEVNEQGELLDRSPVSRSWLRSGVYEHPSEEVNSLLYASVDGTVERQVVDEVVKVSTVYSANLGTAASITVDAVESKWYFFYEGVGPHLSGEAVVGSAPAGLSFGEELEGTLQVLSLQTSDAIDRDVTNYVGDYFGALGLSSEKVFLSGSSALTSLGKESGALAVESAILVDPALVTDLSSNRLYALGDTDGDSLHGATGFVGSLIPLRADSATRDTERRVVYLIRPVYIGVGSLVLSGYHRLLLVDRESAQVFAVSFVTGAVTALPDALPRTLGGQYWMVSGAAARPSAFVYEAVYAALDGTIERQVLSEESEVETLATRAMGTSASITVDALEGKWHYVFSDEAGDLSDGVVLGTAAASVLIGTIGPSGPPVTTPTVAPTPTGVPTPTVVPTVTPLPIPTAKVFRVVQLTTKRARAIDVAPLAGSYIGMVAASATTLFAVGYDATVAVPRANFDLFHAVAVSDEKYTFVTDLATQQVYALANAAEQLLQGPTGILTSLLPLHPDTAEVLTDDSPVVLSEAIYLGHSSGVFSGFGRIVVVDGDSGDAHVINLGTGVVSSLVVPVAYRPGTTSYWVVQGTLEHETLEDGDEGPDGVDAGPDGADSASADGSVARRLQTTTPSSMESFALVYSSITGEVERQALVAGSTTETIFTSPLGDSATVAVDPWSSSWVFHYEGDGVFGSGDAVLGEAYAAVALAAEEDDVFQVLDLKTDSVEVFDATAINGPFNGAVAASESKLFAVGVEGVLTVPADSFDIVMAALSNHTVESLVSDLANRQLYAPGDATGNVLASSATGIIDSFVPLRAGELTVDPMVRVVYLSDPIYIGGRSTLYSGYHRVIVEDGESGDAVVVNLRTGLVHSLGSVLPRVAPTPASLSYGVMERRGADEYAVLGASLEGGVERRLVRDDDAVETVVDGSLGDVASLTLDISRDLWYFYYIGDGMFGDFDAVLGRADAVLTQVSPQPTSTPTLSPTTVDAVDDEALLAALVLTSEDAVAFDVSTISGDFANTLVVSSTHVFIRGATTVVGIAKDEFSLQSVTTSAALAISEWAMFSDLANGQLYAMCDSEGEVLLGPTGFVEGLVPLKSDTALRDSTKRIVWLQRAVYVGMLSGVHSGYRRVILRDDETGDVHVISTVTGAVTLYGTTLARAPITSDWFAVGSATHPHVGEYELMYASIEGGAEQLFLNKRDNASDFDVAFSGSLGDSGSIAVDPETNSWYYFYAEEGVFGESPAMLGRAATAWVNESDASELLTVFSFGTADANSADVEELLGSYHGPLALSSSKLFVVGSLASISLPIDTFDVHEVQEQHDLHRPPALVTNLATERMYALGDESGDLLVGPTGILGCLIPVQDGYLARDGRRRLTWLSRTIYLGQSSGVYSGYNWVAVRDGETGAVWKIHLPSGRVRPLGDTLDRASVSPFWMSTGVSEQSAATQSFNLLYSGLEGGVERQIVNGNETVCETAFSYPLGNVASIAVRVSTSRWYFCYEGEGFFGDSDAIVGSATADIAVGEIQPTSTPTSFPTAYVVDDEALLGAVLLTDGDAQAVDVSEISGRFAGGLAVSSTHVFARGATAMVALWKDEFSLLSVTTSTGDEISEWATVSDLANNRLYAFCDGEGDVLAGPVGVVEGLMPLQADTAVHDTTKRVVWLKRPVYIGFQSSVYSGYRRLLVRDEESGDIHVISTVTGAVTPYGTTLPRASLTSNWLAVGSATHPHVGEYELMYASIEGGAEQLFLNAREDASDVSVALSAPLGSAASLALDHVNQTWYYFYEGVGEFGSSAALLGRADIVTLNVTDGSDKMAVASLGTEDAMSADVSETIGGFVGSLVLSSTKVFVGGIAATASLPVESLDVTQAEVQHSANRDLPIVVTNLASEQLYALGDEEGRFLSGPTGAVGCLIPLQDRYLVRDGRQRIIWLSESVYLGHMSGVYSGYNFVALRDGDSGDVWKVRLHTGAVQSKEHALDRTGAAPHWLSVGVAEQSGLTDTFNLLYSGLGGGVERQVVDGEEAVCETIFNHRLGNVASIAVRVTTSRWYFCYEGEGVFGDSVAMIGSSLADIIAGEMPTSQPTSAPTAASQDDLSPSVVLTDEETVVLDVSESVGDWDGTLAISQSRVFVGGSNGWRVYEKDFTSDSTAVSVLNAEEVSGVLVSNLATNQLYALADHDGEVLVGPVGRVDSLVPLNPATGTRNTSLRIVWLTQTVYLGYQSSAYSGYHRVLLRDEDSSVVHAVDLNNGRVTFLDSSVDRSTPTASWVTVGFAAQPRLREFELTYGSMDGSAELQILSGRNSGEVLAALDSDLLGDHTSLTVDTLEKKWYFYTTSVDATGEATTVLGHAAVANVTVEDAADSFRVVRLELSGGLQTDVSVTAGAFYGQLAVTGDTVFVTGSTHSVSLKSEPLSSATAVVLEPVDGVHPVLVTNLATEQLYALGDEQGEFVSQPGAVVSCLIPMLPKYASRDGRRRIVWLSNELYLGYESGIASGYHRVLLRDGESSLTYAITLQSGQVTLLGVVLERHDASPHWLRFGVAEQQRLTDTDEYEYSLLYSSVDNSVERQSVTDSAAVEAVLDGTPGVAGSIAVSAQQQRWYYFYQGSDASPVLGYADAEILIGEPQPSSQPTSYPTVSGTEEDIFRLTTLNKQEAVVLDVSDFAGYAVGGITLSSSKVFLRGSDATVAVDRTRFVLGTLTSSANQAVATWVTVTNLATNQIFALGDGDGHILVGPIGFVECLIPLLADSAFRDSQKRVLWLSRTVYLGYQSSALSGYQRVILRDDESGMTFLVNLRNGRVKNLENTLHRPSFMPEWLSGGVTVHAAVDDFDMVYASADGTVEVQSASLVKGNNTVDTIFASELGAMASVSVDTNNSVWYFGYSGAGVFGTSRALLGHASSIVLYEEEPEDIFKVLLLTDLNATAVDVSPLVGGYYGGFALSGSKVFITGATDSITLPSDSLNVSKHASASSHAISTYTLVTNLRNNQLYALGNTNGTFLSGPAGMISCLIPVDGTTGYRNTMMRLLWLTAPVYLGFQSAVYSGYNRVLFMDGESEQLRVVSTHTGRVTVLSDGLGRASFSPYWITTGVAEHPYPTSYNLLYASLESTVERQPVGGRANIEPVSWVPVGNTASLAMDAITRTWYLYYEGDGHFGTGRAVVAKAGSKLRFVVPTPIPPDYFIVNHMSSNDGVSIEASEQAGAFYGTLAVSATRVIVSGSGATVSYPKGSLDKADYRSVSLPRNTIVVSDVEDGALFALGDRDHAILTGVSGYITCAIPLLPDTAERDTTKAPIELEKRVFYTYKSSIYSGRRRFFVVDKISSMIHTVSLRDGAVLSQADSLDRFQMSSPALHTFGIAEQPYKNESSIVYVALDGSLERQKIAAVDYMVTPMYDANLGDVASVAFDNSTNQWFFFYSGDGEFGSGPAILGHASATAAFEVAQPTSYPTNAPSQAGFEDDIFYARELTTDYDVVLNVTVAVGARHRGALTLSSDRVYLSSKRGLVSLSKATLSISANKVRLHQNISVLVTNLADTQLYTLCDGDAKVLSPSRPSGYVEGLMPLVEATMTHDYTKRIVWFTQPIFLSYKAVVMSGYHRVAIFNRISSEATVINLRNGRVSPLANAIDRLPHTLSSVITTAVVERGFVDEPSLIYASLDGRLERQKLSLQHVVDDLAPVANTDVVNVALDANASAWYSLVSDYNGRSLSLTRAPAEFVYHIEAPTSQPSGQPSSSPSAQPTLVPTSAPSPRPTPTPTATPTVTPSAPPTLEPSSTPKPTLPGTHMTFRITQVFDGLPANFNLRYNYWLVKSFLNVLPSVLHPGKEHYIDVSLISSDSALTANGASREVTVVVEVHVRADDFVFETVAPTAAPTARPTIARTDVPTAIPTNKPTPTPKPSAAPTRVPTTRAPTAVPTRIGFRRPGEVIPLRSDSDVATDTDRDGSRRKLISPVGREFVYGELTGNYNSASSAGTVKAKMVADHEPQAAFDQGAYEIAPYVAYDTVYTPTAVPTAVPSTAAPTLYPFAPVLTQFVVSKTRATITLNMTLSPVPVYAGTVYCTAVQSPEIISQLAEVLVSGFTKSFVVGQRRVSVTISNLVPLTTYNVYCTVVNTLKNGNPLLQVLSTAQKVTTSCCRILSFSRAPYFVYTTSMRALSYQYTYSLDSAPSANLTVTPVLYNATSGVLIPSSKMFVRPASANFLGGTEFRQSSFIFLSVGDNYAGNFLVRMNFSGPSSGEFYPVAQEFVGLAAAAIKPAPNLATATFTDSGAAIIIVFDSATNRAGLGFDFWSCDKVFDYAGAKTATCVWMSSTVVKASFGEYSRDVPFVTIGENVTLIEDVLRAECLSGIGCNEYPKAASQTVKTAGPPNPVAPKVVLVMYGTITKCDNLTIDSSLSSGHGSRDWAYAVWEVSSSTAPTQEVETFLNDFGTDIRKALSVPHQLLRGDAEYTISLTVTNFLGVTSTGSDVVFVDSRGNLPLLSILQSKVVTIQPITPLHIYTNVRRSACAEDYTIAYEWRMYHQDGSELNFAQTSRDPTELLLRSFALTSRNQYVASVTATASRTNNSAPVSATASVTVSVVPGAVVAVIAGGSQRNALTKRKVSIDASRSYDSNIPGRNSTGFSYAWRCLYATAAKFGSTCRDSRGNALVPATATDNVLSFSGSLLSLTDVYQFFVVVQSADGRVGTANVTITPLGPEVDTEVLITSSVTKVNFDEKLEVLGSLTASYPLHAEWSAYIDGYPTAFAALTAKTASFSVVELTTNPFITFPIAIDRNVLSPGSLVTFRLTADQTGKYSTLGASKYGAFCEITVLINAPPSGGSYRVAPLQGEALTTLFTMVAPSWSDEVEDLPLLFSFLYRVADSDPYLQLQAKKGVTTVQSYLPQGVLATDYMVTTTVIVFDSPGASVNSSLEVEVVPADIDYLAYLQASLDTSGESVIDTSVAAATINNVASSLGVTNCSATPIDYCTSLHRQPCVNTPNTCGTCKDGYVGIVGDLNRPCITKQEAADLLPFNATCTTGSQCLYGECVFGRCSAPILSCPSDDPEVVCSGHGSCVYSDPTGRVLDSCTQLDTKCYATCECTEGYGGRSCAYNETALAYRDATRQLMCDYFSVIAETSNLSPLLMDAFVGTVLSAYDPMEASANTTASCYKALLYLADFAADGGLVGTKKATADFLLSGATQFVKSVKNATALTEALGQISAGVTLSMTDGQEPVGITSGGMRMQVVKSQASTVSTLEPPRSAAEKAYGQAAGSGMEMAPGSASECDSGGGYVSMSVVQWSSSPFPGADTLETPQMKFESRVSASARRKMLERRELRNDDDPYAGQTPSYYISFQFNAPKYFDPNVDFIHASPLERSNLTFPECTFFDPVTETYKPCEGCAISSYTNYNVTYGCYDIGSVCGGGTGAVSSRLRRFLADDDGDDGYGYGQQTSITSINFGALLSTFTGVLGQNPLAINFEKAKIIISFVICLSFIIYFGYWYFRRMDIIDRHALVYNKPDARLKLHDKIAEQSMKMPLGRESFLTHSSRTSSNEVIQEDNPMHAKLGLPAAPLAGDATPPSEPLKTTKYQSRFSQMFSRLTSNLSSAVVGMVRAAQPTAASEGAGLSDLKYSAVVDLDAEEEVDEKTAFANEIISGYISSVMPDERSYSDKTTWTDIAYILMMQHPYTVMFFGPSLQNTRVIRWTGLVTGLLVSLFIDTLIFSTFFPDTGECESYTDEELCLTPINSALGTPLCTWLADKAVTGGGSCTLTPPPEDMTFTMVLTMITIVIAVPIGFALDVVVESYCRLRPNFAKWGYSNEVILGASTQYAASFNQDEQNSTVRILRDNFDQVKREEAKKLNAAKLAEYERGLADKAKRELKKYNYESPKIFAEFDTPDSEAVFLLEEAKRFLDETTQRSELPWNTTKTSNEVDEKIASIQEYLGMYPDGSPIPLSLWDQFWYGDAKNKVITMIDEARGGAEEIRDALQELGEKEMASKEVALIQFFMAENFSSYKQYILTGHLFAFNDSNPLFVHPGKWLAGWFFIISAQLFFIYWMLMWGVSSGGKAMQSWGVNFAIGAIQDIFCLAPVRTLIMYVIAMTSIKPQLRHMHRVLHIIAMNYVQDKLPDNYEVIKVVQHFSPACRAARMHVCADLAAGEILRALDDKDANDCRRSNHVGLSMVVLAFIAIPIFVGVLSETGGDLALDTALPSLLGSFILANALAYEISVFLVIIPYLAIVMYFLIKWYLYAPALKRVQKIRAEKERRNATVARTDVGGWNTALRGAPLSTIAWMKFSTAAVDFAAFSIYYMGFTRLIRKRWEKFLGEAEAERLETQWQIMNLPLPMQGRVLGGWHTNDDKHAQATTAEGKEEAENLWSTLPHRVRKMCPGRDWMDKWDLEGEDDEGDYLTDLMNRRWFHAAPAPEEEDDDVSLTNEQRLAEFAAPKKIFQSSLVATQFREFYSFCYDADSVLLHLLFSYRKQLLGGRLYHVSLLDEQTLTAAASMEELASYQGVIHVRDLAMILADLLHYYRPYGTSLSPAVRKFIIAQYDKWVGKHCVAVVDIGTDIDNPPDRVHNLLNRGITVEEDPADLISGYYEPCSFAYRIVNDFSGYDQLHVAKDDDSQPTVASNTAEKEKPKATVARLEKDYTVLFTDICRMVMDEEVPNAHGEKRGFLGAPSLPAAPTAAGDAPQKVVADAGVAFDLFAAWFLDLNERLLPRLAKELGGKDTDTPSGTTAVTLGATATAIKKD